MEKSLVEQTEEKKDSEAPVDEKKEDTITLDDIERLNPALIQALCQSQHRMQSKFLIDVVLSGSITDLSGSVLLSKTRVEHLKKISSTQFIALEEKRKKEIQKHAVHEFAPVLFTMASLYLANYRLSEIVSFLQTQLREMKDKEGSDSPVGKLYYAVQNFVDSWNEKEEDNKGESEVGSNSQE